MVAEDKKLINVAIDGHSSCGKSTLAKNLAEELGYIYIDTGAMFRAVSLFALENELVHDGIVDVERLVRVLPLVNIDFQDINGSLEILLNDKPVGKEIRSMRVSNIVSPVSTIKEVRDKLLNIQQELGKNKGVIMDGRDIGTVVFPDAELKVFLTASAEVRAKRRTLELENRGLSTPYKVVFDNLRERDYIDSNRDIAPLKMADDAVMIDNSEMSLEESLAMVRDKIKEVLQP
ncbi:MAG: cytidylate kinase [Flavobacteriales bacterium]|jgi:cytidylate kinase